MLGFLITLVDLGILTGGNAKRHAEGNYNRKVAKLYNKSYYQDGFNRYRSTENGHIVTVTGEGVRDTKTGILLEDYEEKRKKELERYEKKIKEELERNLEKYLNAPGNKYKTWVEYCGYYYNRKTGRKAVNNYSINHTYLALYEPEYKYYIDDMRYYFNANPNEPFYERQKQLFINDLNYKLDDYNDYLKMIEYNQKLYEKYQNKEFVEKNGIELIPVSIEEFIDRFKKNIPEDINND